MSNDESSPRDAMQPNSNQEATELLPDEARLETQPRSGWGTDSKFLMGVFSIGVAVTILLPFVQASRDGYPASRSDRLERERRAEELAAQIDAMKAEIAADASRVAVTQPGE